MNHKLLIASGLFAALALMAAPEGDVSKSASGSTSATVYFEPGSKQAALVVADVTSDKAASVLSWKVGEVQVTLLKAAAANTTNLVTTVGTLASNAAIVSVTSDGTVTAHTAFTNGYSTNWLMTLHNAIGTNSAVGDPVREVTLGTYSTLQHKVPATSNLWLVDNSKVWAVADPVLVATPTVVFTNRVASYSTNTIRPWVIGDPAPFDLDYGTVIRELTTNTYLLADAEDDATLLHVAATNGFVEDASIVIQRTNGALYTATIDSGGVDTTNITLTATLGNVLSVGDIVWAVATTDRTLANPVTRGDTILPVVSTAGQNPGDVCVTVTAPPWLFRVKDTNALTAGYVLTCSNATAVALQPGARIHPLTTNIYNTTFAELGTTNRLIIDSTNGIAAGDSIVLIPATGGAVLRQVSGAAAYRYQLQTIKAVTGLALAAGDRVFVLGTAVTTPVGSATLRLTGDPIRVLPVNTPGVLSIDGTSACAINSAIVRY